MKYYMEGVCKGKYSKLLKLSDFRCHAESKAKHLVSEIIRKGRFFTSLRFTQNDGREAWVNLTIIISCTVNIHSQVLDDYRLLSTSR